MDITYNADLEGATVTAVQSVRTTGVLVRCVRDGACADNGYHCDTRVSVWLSYAQATELVRQLIDIDGVADGVQAALDHRRYGVGVPS
jgi:hypothetical protein